MVIPQELYQDIVSHLNHDHDIGTRALLSVAQCSSVLRHEAQRVLFRHPFAFLWQDSDKQNCRGFSILRTHEAFLEAILLAPTSLGPLVRSYNQFQVSYSRQETDVKKRTCYMDAMEARKGQRSHVYELTEKALPFMTNLKYLYFMTLNGLTTSPKVLLQCSFQLELMEWYAPGDKRDIAGSLLPRQQRLRHLDAPGWDATKIDPESISKNLVSVRGSLEDLSVLSRGRTIVAFEHHEAIRGRSSRIADTAYPRREDGLGSLKYLRVANYKTYLRLLGKSSPAEVFQNLLLLELVFWSPVEISTFTLLPPTLQVLVLIDRVSGLGSGTVDIALSAFSALPHLQYVDLGDCCHNSSVVIHRYNRLPESADTDVGSTERMSRETILFDRGWGDHWWRDRAASLGWIEGTEDTMYRYMCERRPIEQGNEM
ncbi:hypothetical protein D9619_005081 [Psilocybe cf. subviscida]|uniref:Uncharacterized protein n=1 Tax=Psilocybe cf. subviscida TaxID=2480587 RepID=A0A8H5F8A4_9AGAR|nr:hypothetical protein D9619_005081 [Psilocybe cf. subviscida]